MKIDSSWGSYYHSTQIHFSIVKHLNFHMEETVHLVADSQAEETQKKVKMLTVKAWSRKTFLSNDNSNLQCFYNSKVFFLSHSFFSAVLDNRISFEWINSFRWLLNPLFFVVFQNKFETAGNFLTAFISLRLMMKYSSAMSFVAAN